VTRQLTYFNIKGERCSGTNYLEKLIVSNLKIEVKHTIGWKHGWFEPREAAKLQQEFLTIVIFRNFTDWIRSLYLQPWHLVVGSNTTFRKFISMKVLNDFGVNGSGVNKELLDRHPFTFESPKNLFETRKWKGEHFLSLRNIVPNIHYIKYEDLVANPEKIVKEINDKWFNIDYEFQNWTNYKSTKDPYVKRTYADISEDDKNFIIKNIDWDLEARMGYLSIFN
jgi:hypothetical protein